MLSPGTIVGGKYRIVRLIGDGGMGSVYEARHERLGTGVALKFLHADLAERPGLATRFLQEGQVAATIRSPHVAQVTDVDTSPDGRPYLVMELLSGESLQRILDREGKLSQQRAVDFALQILSGLESAHHIHVVHRDLKPDNVFVTPGHDGPVLKLIDFGIAKLREGAERGLTRAGVVMGTPEYMPPEQLYTANEVDERADLYALGVMLFEMLSGKRPADGEDATEIVSKVLTGDVLKLEALEPGLPPELVAIVRRATLPDREARFPNAVDMRHALVQFAAEGQAVPRTLPPETRRLVGGTALPAAPPEAPPPNPTRDATPGERAVSSRGSTEMAPPIPGPAPAWPAPVRVQPRKRRGAGPLLALLVVLLVVGAAGAGGAYLWWLDQYGSSTAPPLGPTIALPTAEPPRPSAGDFTATPLPTPSPIPTAPGPVTPTATPRPGTTRPSTSPSASSGPTPPFVTDGGLLPFPLPIPSTFPPLPPLPSNFPTTLPSGFPTVFPGIPGFGPPPPAPSADAGRG
ncbi:MAG TPA: protein kinase [Polyangiaceae bacterium]